MKSYHCDVGETAIPSNPTLATFSRRLSLLNERQSAKINRLLQDDDVHRMAFQRLDFQLLSLAHLTSVEAQREALRHLPNFSSIVLELEPVYDLNCERRKTARVSASNSKRAKKLRNIIEGVPLVLRIKELIEKPERRAEPAVDLWPHLISMFSELEVNAREIIKGTTANKRAISYDVYPRGNQPIDTVPKLHTFSFVQFQRTVRELRKTCGNRANG